MPNVTCPQCGTSFESKEKACPNCGAKNNLKICHVCGAQMAKGAKRCPKCGAKNRKPIYKRWWFWVIIIYLLFRIPWPSEEKETTQPAAESSMAETTSQPEPTPTPTPEEPPLELVGETEGIYDSGTNSIHITGKIRNNGDKKFGYVSITFSLYDASGNVVGTAMDNIVNFGAGETWSFDALGISSIEVDRYKITDVTTSYY